MEKLNWQSNLLAAPVVSWVRKHYAEPVTSAAGFVNVGTPTRWKWEVRGPNIYKKSKKLAWTDLAQYKIMEKHWSFLKTDNEADITFLLRMYYKKHLSPELCVLLCLFFEPKRSIKTSMSQFVSNEYSLKIGTCFTSEKFVRGSKNWNISLYYCTNK